MHPRWTRVSGLPAAVVALCVTAGCSHTAFPTSPTTSSTVTAVPPTSSGAPEVRADAPVGPPPEARLAVLIDGPSNSETAIQDFTPIRFTSNGSAAEGSLYTFDFGDGTSGSGPTAVHRCAQSVHGSLLEGRLTVVDPWGRTSTDVVRYICAKLMNQPVYGWITRNNAQSTPQVFRRISFESQAGSQLRGYYNRTTAPAEFHAFTAQLSGARHINIRFDDGTGGFDGDITFDAHVVYIDASHGYGVNMADRSMSLTAKGGTADGMRVDFVYYDPF